MCCSRTTARPDAQSGGAAQRGAGGPLGGSTTAGHAVRRRPRQRLERCSAAAHAAVVRKPRGPATRAAFGQRIFEPRRRGPGSSKGTPAGASIGAVAVAVATGADAVRGPGTADVCQAPGARRDGRSWRAAVGACRGAARRTSRTGRTLGRPRRTRRRACDDRGERGVARPVRRHAPSPGPSRCRGACARPRRACRTCRGRADRTPCAGHAADRGKAAIAGHRQ